VSIEELLRYADRLGLKTTVAVRSISTNSPRRKNRVAVNSVRNRVSVGVDGV